MKYFIILVAFIIVAVVGFRITSFVMSREEPAPVTAIGAADSDESVLGPDRPDIVDTNEDKTPMPPPAQGSTQQPQTNDPLEQETRRLQEQQDVLEQREELQAEQERQAMPPMPGANIDPVTDF